jgi:hypothetical protein
MLPFTKSPYTGTKMTNFKQYAEENLTIINKIGEIVPFVFSPAQVELHDVIEAQLARTGKVRVIINQQRQVGTSTYLLARQGYNLLNEEGKLGMQVAPSFSMRDSNIRIARRMYTNSEYDRYEILFPNVCSVLSFFTSSSTLRAIGAGKGGSIHSLSATEINYFSNQFSTLVPLVSRVSYTQNAEIILGVSDDIYFAGDLLETLERYYPNDDWTPIKL